MQWISVRGARVEPAEVQRVRLAAFIATHLNEILEDWVASARRAAPSRGDLDVGLLREHVADVLREIARDLEAPLEAPEDTRSNGVVRAAGAGGETAAEAHGAGSARYGFTLSEIVSEFGALRSAVIARWQSTAATAETAAFSDLKRFEEALDQTLLASASRFIRERDHAKETFLGILGHDLKTPLSAMIMSARLMLESNGLNPSQRAMLERIERSGERMSRMVSDLLDVTRSGLGSGIPISRADVDLESVVHEAVEEVCASRQERRVDVEVAGDLHGRWDPQRVGQALSNLVSNALVHGAREGRIHVTARGEPDDVILAVHNEGAPLTGDRLGQLFDPLARGVGANDRAAHDENHLGLGLHIAKAIVVAHGGSIHAESSEEQGTTFSIRLPRHE